MLSDNFIKRVIDKLDSVNVDSLKEFILQLREDREFFNTIFSSMIEGVIVVDSMRHVGYINNSARSILSINNDTPLEREVLSHIQNEKLNAYIEEVLQKHARVTDAELNISYPNPKVLRINIIPLLKNGKVIGDIIMLHDITSEKLEKLKLRRAESLAALTTLAAGVAHEIKNPLGSIDIHVQLVERLFEKMGDNKYSGRIQPLLEVIHEEIGRLNDIVKDFLFTVRPVELSNERVDMYDFMYEIASFLKHEANEKGTEIVFEVPKNLPQIYVDKRYLKPAFINIIQNAIEACKRGGSVEISGIDRDDTIEIKITDNGCGIEQGKIDKIFEPYYSTKDTGTGLGLTIVYKIIREHGGNILVESVEDKGTTFTVILPTEKIATKKGLEYSG
jgi:nitrogen fixation/metabolism regulation signal transduction histidine kinase